MPRRSALLGGSAAATTAANKPLLHRPNHSTRGSQKRTPTAASGYLSVNTPHQESKTRSDVALVASSWTRRSSLRLSHCTHFFCLLIPTSQNTPFMFPNAQHRADQSFSCCCAGCIQIATDPSYNIGGITENPEPTGLGTDRKTNQVLYLCEKPDARSEQ